MNEARHENTPETAAEHRIPFLKGFLGGALIGTAAGLLFAPQINAALRNSRRQVTDTAAGAGDAAAEKYREATTRVGDAVDDLQQKGRAVYGKTLTAVARGAEDVKARAIEARSELDQSAERPARRSL